MTKLILVRHGVSDTNITKAFAGQFDTPLSAQGLSQAQRAAEFISQNFSVDKIYSSDLQRAYNTACPISSKTGIEIITSQNLREINAGKWQGMKFDDILLNYAEDYNTWLTDIGKATCTGGESVKQLCDRILAEIRRIADENLGKTVVIVTHATPIRILQCIWQNMPLEKLKDVNWVSNCSLTIAEYDGNNFTLAEIGRDDFMAEFKTAMPANV